MNENIEKESENKNNNIVLGTMNINYPFTSNPIHNEKYYKSMIEMYIRYINSKPILDTAYYYGNTTCEQLLGSIIPSLSVKPIIATKVNPWLDNNFTLNKYGQLNKENLPIQLNTSLKNLKIDKADILYLHCHDYESELKETLEVCDQLYRKEKFDKFGISNYSLSHVFNILEICEENGYILPNYYQGMYNLIARKVEEIFPIINKKGIEFWAYNPLAGGILTGKYKDYNKESLPLGRFKNNEIYQNIFWKQPILDNLNNHFFHFKKEKCIQYSYKWLQNYSKMRKTDKIIIGASSIEQLIQNIEILQTEKNTIDHLTTINYLNSIYEPIKEFSPNYYY